MTTIDLRCPKCNILLKEADSVPEPMVIDDRMRLDIDCPGCGVPLAVFLEVVDGDGITVRKFVELRDDR